MNTAQFLESIQNDPEIKDRIVGVYTIPEKKAVYSQIPDLLDASLTQALNKQGIERLYIHQSQAIQAAMRGENVVVVTPTASGKSLTYMLPVFQRKTENKNSRALFLFPTKALSQDQMSAIDEFSGSIRFGMKVFTFDGDTPGTARTKIREAGDIVVTNPDMLHSGILPHHTQWIRLFENLEYIVIDELHTYRGIFGSHVANVIRRLKRIAKFYGSSPKFIATSATIGNPKELAESITEEPFTLIDENGAPSAQKHFVFYNPPVVQKELGIRKSSLKEAALLGSYLIRSGIRPILFARSRVRVELLATYLRERCPQQAAEIKSYRGGYLPNERRAIEKGLREGKLRAVVSTNALELGIDIGTLDVSVTLGFPGSISSFLQQAGRAGRAGQESISFLIATSDGTDQYLVNHSEFITDRNPENARINADNLLIVSDHLKCAAFELPFLKTELFGRYSATVEILEHLESNRILKENDEQYYWESDVYPAGEISLRQGPKENFVIVDITDPGKEQVIGELDYFSAPVMIHDHAIYIHQGTQYYVEKLLWDDRQARVRKIETDYYTDAQDKVDVAVLEQEVKRELPGISVYSGEISMRRKAVMFKKIKLETHENTGWGEIHLPEIEMHTQSGWISFETSLIERLANSESDAGAMISGAAHALGVVAPVYVLCDRNDLRFRSEVRSTIFKKPTIYCYDNFPGGLDLSYGALRNLPVIAKAAYDLISSCSCENGCPACTGIPEPGLKDKVKQVLQPLEN